MSLIAVQHTPHRGDALARALRDPETTAIPSMLRAVREHLGLEAAFVGEFHDGRRSFRYVDGSLEPLIHPGGSDPLEDSYCLRVVDGRLPELIPDVAALAGDHDLPDTGDVRIGAHVSVPIRLPDGEVYGTLCCVDRRPQPDLSQRDLGVMRLVAQFLADRLAEERAMDSARRLAAQRIRTVLERASYRTLFQPIVELATGTPHGHEALTRFLDEPQRTPDVWFAEAASAGLRPELEIATLRAAIDRARALRTPGYLSVNVSPHTLVDERLPQALAPDDLSDLVLEVTEHDAVSDYPTLWRAVDMLRQRRARLAIDDMGAGFSGLSHVLRLSPDILKLDRSLVQGIDRDPARQAMAVAMVQFARSTRADLVAEGVETNAELDALIALGVRLGQGYLLGRPAPAGGSDAPAPTPG